MKKKELIETRKKETKELIKTVINKKRELLKVMLDIKIGKEKNLKKAKLIKKEIAQLLTVINEKNVVK